MHHPIYRVVGVATVAPYTLQLSFSDGSEQRIDFRPVLEGPLFGALQDVRLFEQVALDAEAGTVVWPNGADFDPATLHDWPSVRHELAARAEQWATVAKRRAG